MKYVWELADIEPGWRATTRGRIYTIVSVDSKEKTNIGYALLSNNRVTPTYTREELVEMFNSQGCIPLPP